VPRSDSVGQETAGSRILRGGGAVQMCQILVSRRSAGRSVGSFLYYLYLDVFYEAFFGFRTIEEEECSDQESSSDCSSELELVCKSVQVCTVLLVSAHTDHCRSNRTYITVVMWLIFFLPEKITFFF
jgi:hypothetical protein